MLKIVLIILCALMFAGLLGLDFFITKAVDRQTKNEKNDDDSDNK